MVFRAWRGLFAAGDRGALHRRSRSNPRSLFVSRPGRRLERPLSGSPWRSRLIAMSERAAVAFGQVAAATRIFPSPRVIAPRFRAPVLAFYRFRPHRRRHRRPSDARARSQDRAARPHSRKALTGEGAARSDRRAAAHGTLAERNLTPRHALDLIDAFRLDVTKTRYRDFDDLIDYCRLSAMPVGRYVLDVHGEDRADLGGVRQAVRRAADHQSPAGLREGFSRSRPRLHSRRRLSRARMAPASKCSATSRAPAALRARRSSIWPMRTQDLLAESAMFPIAGARPQARHERRRRSRSSRKS